MSEPLFTNLIISDMQKIDLIRLGSWMLNGTAMFAGAECVVLDC